MTVTHPEVQRSCMLIPEAVPLVLQAAALGHSGAVYGLEREEHITRREMARNLMRLSGCIPDEEIPMTFIGVRPGEKLCEALVGWMKQFSRPAWRKSPRSRWAIFSRQSC